MRAEPVSHVAAIPTDVDVVSVSFTPHETNVVVLSPGANAAWRISFYGASGIRVLDEGDLSEFWPACSAPNGPLFRIVAGGWRDHEAKRLRCGGWTDPEIPEYFIAGNNSCVGVLSVAAPEVHPCDLPEYTRQLED